jgi:hypothetical protein
LYLVGFEHAEQTVLDVRDAAGRQEGVAGDGGLRGQ